MMSGILMSIGVIIFGFSVNLAMAIVARFLTGFFGGKKWDAFVFEKKRYFVAGCFCFCF